MDFIRESYAKTVKKHVYTIQTNKNAMNAEKQSKRT